MSVKLIIVKRAVCLLIAFSFLSRAFTQDEVDVLILGGGAGGTAAAIQAARADVKVKILEPTNWLGGMLTSAGVSAIDGNHELPSGLWGEFRQRLRDHYAGANTLATGWVSHALFEPHIGNKILNEMADMSGLEIVFKAKYQDILKRDGSWEVSYQLEGKTHTTKAKILIDATETGEILPLVQADFRLGMDAQQDTAEKQAPQSANTIVQDLTYVAILEDVGTTEDLKGLVEKPVAYDPEAYKCACKRDGNEMFGSVTDCLQMLNYGKLPNNKYMINWPNCGNDSYVPWPELSDDAYKVAIEHAKTFTQGFVYYIQNELGFDHLRLADEFPTKDGYPMIPYHREGRRVKGKVFLTADHLEKPYDFDLYRTGIAVGDYPIDHHHDKNAEAPQIDFIEIKIPSYNVPLGVLIPESTENFLVAEKNISVSNIVNGTTRLQPVVLGVGQAAGAIAVTVLQNNQNTSEVSVRSVQQQLLKAQVYLMPFIDVKPEDPAFQAVQRIGATGILKGQGVPYKWANQSWFFPKQVVSEIELKEGLIDYYPEIVELFASEQAATPGFLLHILSNLNRKISTAEFQAKWMSLPIDQEYETELALNRRTISILLDTFLNPFELPIDLHGKIIGNR